MAAPRDLRAPLVSVAATGAALTAAMLVLGSTRAGVSTGAGALVATLNLYAMGQILGATLGRDEKEGGAAAGAWRVLGALKVLILFGGVWFLLTSHAVDPIPFVVGLGALPIGLVTGSLLSPSRANEAPGPAKGAPRNGEHDSKNDD